MLSKDVWKLFVWFYCVFCLKARREHAHSPGATAVTVERHRLGGGGIIMLLYNMYLQYFALQI